MMARRGSSPLARGLRRGMRSDRISPRIIPARAGFTAGARGGNRGRSDHPRSRGVYSGEVLRSANFAGSSPLARGLRPPLGAVCDSPGIIPARAGFTGESSDDGVVDGDHPRSRGVYVMVTQDTGRYAGSSPLARGLRPHHPAHLGRGRIIPARTGFTVTSGSRRDSPRDHPRSRGVYNACDP